MRQRCKKVMGGLAAAALVAGAFPALAEAAADVAEARPAAAEKAPAVQVGGLNVAVDPETGRIRPLTLAEQRKLAAAMKKQFGVKAQEPVVHADGMFSAVVGTEFLSYSVARLAADGTVERQCAASVDSAIDFLAGDDASTPAAEQAAASANREER